MDIIAVFLLLISFANPTLEAIYYPNPQISSLEHILIDTGGAFRSGFKDAITPCTNYIQGPQTTGRESAAQWIRVIFHDFVTARVDQGIGGVDASIGFETLRDEDSGTAFNDSFSFWRTWVNDRVSMADLVAMGTVVSVGNCGGPQIPYRGGRVDATEAGPFGVPAPDTDLPTTLQFFANSGFNQVDSIRLTACGHTLGSVHHGGFPTVVDNSTVSPNNTQGASHLDSTNAVFDILVVDEYLTGTGMKGGPLVTSFNVSSRSDLRLYTSDNNATMQDLSQSTDHFFNTCVNLFERMSNTVPANVTLTDVIEPMTWKPINTTFDFDGESLVLSGVVRYLETQGTAAKDVTLQTNGIRTLAVQATELPATGSNIWGTTYFYPFNFSTSADGLPIDALSVSSSGKTVATWSVQNQIFFSPSLSSIANSNTPGFVTVNMTAAALDGNSRKGLDAVVAIPSPQQGTLAPRVEKQSMTFSPSGSIGAFTLYSGSVTMNETLLRQASVDLSGTVNGKPVVDEFNQLYTIPGAPAAYNLGILVG